MNHDDNPVAIAASSPPVALFTLNLLIYMYSPFPDLPPIMLTVFPRVLYADVILIFNRRNTESLQDTRCKYFMPGWSHETKLG